MFKITDKFVFSTRNIYFRNEIVSNYCPNVFSIFIPYNKTKSAIFQELPPEKLKNRNLAVFGTFLRSVSTQFAHSHLKHYN